MADHLVDRVHHWPGVNGLAALLAARPLRATRPSHFFRSDGSMPDALELPLTWPAELGPAAAVRSELRERVRAVELERAAERARTGRRVLGRRAVLAQSWCEGPVTVEPRRNLRPRIATRSQWPRIDDLLRNRAFAADYARARDRWRTGHNQRPHRDVAARSGARYLVAGRPGRALRKLTPYGSGPRNLTSRRTVERSTRECRRTARARRTRAADVGGDLRAVSRPVRLPRRCHADRASEPGDPCGTARWVWPYASGRLRSHP